MTRSGVGGEVRRARAGGLLRTLHSIGPYILENPTSRSSGGRAPLGRSRRDCVKSLRSSYMGLYPQSSGKERSARYLGGRPS